jgi:hypothetical protein
MRNRCLQRWQNQIKGLPQWDGVAALPLGQLGLELVTTNPETRRVLLPRKGAMPL